MNLTGSDRKCGATVEGPPLLDVASYTEESLEASCKIFGKNEIYSGVNSRLEACRAAGVVAGRVEAGLFKERI